MKKGKKVYIVFSGRYYEAHIVGKGFDPNGFSRFDYVKYRTRVGTLNIHKNMKCEVFDSKIDAICYMVTTKPKSIFSDGEKYRRTPYSEEKMYKICRKYHPELLI